MKHGLKCLCPICSHRRGDHIPALDDHWSPEQVAAAITMFVFAVVAVILLWAYARQLPLNQ